MGRHSIPGPGGFSEQPDERPREPEPAGLDDAEGPEEFDYGDYDPVYPDPAQYLRQRPVNGDTDADAEPRAGLSQWQGGHRNEAGRRGVSVGVIAALVTVIAVVSGVILWRFFGTSLSQRSGAAAGRCVDGNLTVAVVADPAIADHVHEFAERYNKSAKPVGDRCVSVQVKPADSDAVINGFIGDWPAQLGDRPALWIPGSSVSTARLQAAAGREIVSDSRSLVTSPVLLAVRPALKSALDQHSWATLPGLQSNLDALAGLGLPGWGPLRLALPLEGNSDAAFLAGEAVAAAAAPPGAPANAGVAAVRTLAAGQPKLPDNSLAEAMNTLLRPDNPAASPVHAVATTEQQLFARAKSLSDPADTLAWWRPPGPVPVADYPAVLLAGSWLSQEQVTAASEFARFSHKPDQLAALAEAGFRVEGVKPPGGVVTDFAPLPATLSVGDDALRASLANTLTAPASNVAVSLMLDLSMATEEGGKTRLANVIAALQHGIRELPGNSAVGLWTFDGTEGRTVLPVGPLDEPLDGQPRGAALASRLDNLSSTAGGAVSFTTLRLVYNQALSNYRAGQDNSVLVITAGPHTDQTLDGAGLQAFVQGAVDPQRPVAVNVVDFGADPDQPTWQAVARLSGGSYQNLATSASAELAGVLSTLLS